MEIILKYLGLHNFKMILPYSSYSKLVYVTTRHMTLRFEIFGRESANGKEETGKIGQGIYTIV